MIDQRIHIIRLLYYRAEYLRVRAIWDAVCQWADGAAEYERSMRTLDQRLDEANGRMRDALEEHDQAKYNLAYNEAAGLSYHMGVPMWEPGYSNVRD